MTAPIAAPSTAKRIVLTTLSTIAVAGVVMFVVSSNDWLLSDGTGRRRFRPDFPGPTMAARVGLLGAGGMGEVYRARDTKLLQRSTQSA